MEHGHAAQRHAARDIKGGQAGGFQTAGVAKNLFFSAFWFS